MNFSLIIPTFNEATNIARLLERTTKVLQDTPFLEQTEIIIVDDGSTDGTTGLIHSLVLPYPIHIIERQIRGLATAILIGFNKAKHEVVGVIDADLSHPPELLSIFLKEIPKYDLIVGSRHLPGGAVEDWPWYRKLSSQIATFCTRPLGVKLTDPMSGFFIAKKRVLSLDSLSPIGYKILLEIAVKGTAQNIKEIPYIFQNRTSGQSKMGMKETINYLRHILRLYSWKLKTIYYGKRH